jgi:hypothetical protein
MRDVVGLVTPGRWTAGSAPGKMRRMACGRRRRSKAVEREARRIGLVALLALAACNVSAGDAAGPTSTSRASSPTPSDPSPGQGETSGRISPTELLRRELALPRVQSSQACPVSTAERPVPKVAIAVGKDPLFAVLGLSDTPPSPGGVVRFTNEGPPVQGRYASKTIWVVHNYDHELVLRGRQLDGSEPLLFQRSEGDPVEPFLILPAGTDEWKYFPSAIYIGRRGCFGVQFDGLGVVGSIVFQAEP